MSITECEVHEWVAVEEPRSVIEAWACSQCAATSAECAQGGHASGSAIPLCRPCQVRVARQIDQLEEYLGLAIVAEVAKSDMRSPMDYRVQVGGSRIQHESDGAEGLVEIVLGWVAMWADASGATEQGWADYLKGRLIWAATNPEASAWSDFTDEVVRHRAAARGLAGLGPVHLPETCVHCHDLGQRGELVQDRCDDHGKPHPDGLQDEVRCVLCDRRWEDRGAYRLVVRGHLARRADGLVTMEQARALWPEVPAATWRDWRRRGNLPRGAEVYALSDLRALVTRRDEEVARTGMA